VWPFDRLCKRKHDRRYKAALIVLLGASMFDNLDGEQKARVESEVNDNFNRTDTPAIAWNRLVAWDLISAFRAAAMDRLSLEPSVAGLTWSQLFEPWRFWRKVPQWPRRAFDARAATLIYDFRPFDPATAEAAQFLRNCGVYIPDKLPTSSHAISDGPLLAWMAVRRRS